jgi:N-acyl-D-aspartate/D-glutamate deacylase
MVADLVIFNPEELDDKADFVNPMQYAEGIDFLLVNGVPVIDEGALTDAKPGRLLKRGH